MATFGFTAVQVSRASAATGPTPSATAGTEAPDGSVVTPGPLDHLALSPASSMVTAGDSQAYTAEGFDTDGNDLGDVTSATTFSISGTGSCVGTSCSATVPGSYTVTGTDGSAIGTATLVATAASGDWPQFHNGPAHAGYNAAETTLSPSNVADLGVAWTGAGTGGAIYSSPTVSHGAVYVGSGDGKLYAYATGCASHGGACRPLWTGATEGSIYSSPAVAGGVVYVGSDDGLYAFAVGCASGGGTCMPLWQSYVGPLYSSPAVENGVVYAVSAFGSLDAFAVGCASDDGYCSPLWTASTGGYTYSSPAVADGVVYVGSEDDKLYAFAVGCASGGGTCTPLWTAATQKAILSSPAVANGVVYVGSDDGNLYAFAVGCASGGGACTPLWTGATGSYVDSSPAVANGVVYVGSDDGELYAFAVGCAIGDGTCTPLWTGAFGSSIATATLPAPFVASSPAVSGGVIYIGSWDNSLYAFGLPAPGPLDHLALSPTNTTVTAGASQAYTAEGFDASGNDLGDVSPVTTFTISGGGSCNAASCSATAPGTYTVTGTDGTATGTATLYVASVGDWPQFRDGPAHTAYNAAETTISASNVGKLGLYWTANTNGASNRPSAAVADGVVYTGGPTVSAYASGCATGGAACSPLWTGVTDSGVSGSPAVADGVVYVGTLDGTLYAFEAGCSTNGGTCQPLWKGATDGEIRSSPTVADGVVYVSSTDGNLYAFAVGCATGGRSCGPLWTGYTNDNWGYSSPAVADGVVYVGSGDGNLYAFAVGCATSGAACSPLWTGDTGSIVFSSPAVAGGVVYVTSFYGTLYAFAAGCGSAGASCTPLWKAGIGGAFSSPAVANGVVYVGSYADGDLYAFAVGCATGGGTCAPLWTGATNGQIGGSPAVANGVVYIGSGDGKLYAFGVGCASGGGTCAPLWTAYTFDAGYSSPSIADGVVYLDSSDGTLYAYTTPGPFDHVVLSPASATVPAGSSETFIATAVDANGVAIGDVTAGTTFAISPSPAGSCTGDVCSVSGPGQYTVTASYGGTKATATLTAVPAAPASGDWAQFRYGPDHTGDNPAETTISASNVGNLAPLWTATPHRGWSGHGPSATVADGAVYVGDGYVSAFPVGCASGGTSCSPLWTSNADGYIDTAPAVADGAVYAASAGGTLYAFRTGCASGGGGCNPWWQADMQSIYSSPTVSDGVVYVASWDGELYAFASDCESAGRSLRLPASGDCAPLWTGRTSTFPTSPTVAGGVVYVGSADGKLYAFPVGCAGFGGTCSPLWTGATGGSISSSPAVSDGVVYVGSADGKLYAFPVGCASGGGTCSPIWTGATGGSISSSPAVSDGVVYVGSADGKLYAFPVGCASGGGTCSPIWTGATGSSIYSSPSVANGVVYVGSSDGNLYAFAVGCASNQGVCVPLWTGATGDNGYASPAVSNGVVYLDSSDGTLYAFGLAKTTPTITWPSPAAITFGTALGPAQLDATASVPGTFSYAPPAGTVLGAGANQSLAVTFTPTDTTDYTTASGSTTITVNQAIPSITWPTPAPITYGTALGAAQLDATASVPGSFSYAPAAGTLLGIGAGQVLSVSFTPSDSTDYTAAGATTTVSVLAPAGWTTASVADSNGNPLAGVPISFRPASGAVTNLTTGPAGTASTALAPGKYTVTATYANGTQSQALTVSANGPNLVRFSTMAVTVQVDDPSSSDIAAASVSHAGNTGTFGPKAAVSPSGQAVFQALPGTSYFTAYVAGGYQTQSLTVSASGPNTVTFSTVPVTVQVDDPSPSDIAAASVAHAGNTGTFGPKAAVSPSGQAVFQALPGTSYFTAYVAGGYQTQSLTVTASGPNAVSFSTFAVTVTVLKNGGPLATASVAHAGNTGTYGPKVPVGPSGQAVFQALPGTSYFTAWDGSSYSNVQLNVSGPTSTSVSVA
jgi:outer membrane protein assembly factor BamB